MSVMTAGIIKLRTRFSEGLLMKDLLSLSVLRWMPDCPHRADLAKLKERAAEKLFWKAEGKFTVMTGRNSPNLL